MKEYGEFGTIKIKLNELLDQKQLSKTKLSYKAEISRTQINKFCSGEISRFDTITLVKLCNALNCRIEELIEYIPPDETK